MPCNICPKKVISLKVLSIFDAVSRSAEHIPVGSSAALGVIQVRDSCESIQNLGKSKNASGSSDIKEEEAWKQIEELIPTVKDQHVKATRWLEVLCHL